MARFLAVLALVLIVLAGPASAGRTGSEPPLDVQSRTLAAESFAAGKREDAIALMREVVIKMDRQREPHSYMLANDLNTLAGYLDAPDDDTLWDDAEELRLEAITILATLPNANRAHEDAVAALALHYIRREYGGDFIAEATAFFDLVAAAPDADARTGALVADACRLGDFALFPALALDFAAVVNAYLARFSGGDDAAVACAADALSIVLDEGREYDRLLERSAELARLAAADTVGAGAAMRAFDLRARIFLSLGRPDDALAVADIALTRTGELGTPPALRARALAIRAEARLQKSDAVGAAADATDAVLAYDSAASQPAEQAMALALLAEILGAIPDRQPAVEGLIARAMKLAREAAGGEAEGWEKALARSFTLAISHALALGDPAGASRLADELATLKSGTRKLPFVQDWQSIVAFPNNVALLLYRRDFDGAEYYLSLERVALEARYYREHNYLVPPLRRADIAEYGVILDLMRTADPAALDANAMVTALDEALKLRTENLPETHPLLIQHFALRAVALTRLGRNDEAIAAAREGLRRFVARGVPPREAGGTIAGLFVDPVYQQLVVSAWLGLETLPR
ncbi:MAG: hypothetical protein ABI399_12120 [Bauldia sp.]